MTKQRQMTIESIPAPEGRAQGVVPGMLALTALTWAAWGPAAFALPLSSSPVGRGAALLLCPILVWLLLCRWPHWGPVYALAATALVISLTYATVFPGVLLLLNAFLSAGGQAVLFAVDALHPALSEAAAFALLLWVYGLLLGLCVRRGFWLGGVLLGGLPAVATLAAHVPWTALLPSCLVFAILWSALVRRQAAGGSQAPALSPRFFLLAGTAALAVGAAGLLCLWAGLPVGQQLSQGQAALERRADSLRYETGDFLPLLAGGNLNQEHTDFTGETALRITMQRPRSVYLKGFTGGDYADGVWSQPQAPEAVGAEYLGLLPYLASRGFYPQVQVGQTTVVDEGTETAWITVENLAASSKYLFVPYESLMVSDLSQEFAGYQEEGGIRAQGLFGARKYTCSMALPVVEDYALADLTAYAAGTPEAYQEMERLYRTYVYHAYLGISEADQALLEQCFDPDSLARLEQADLAAVTRQIRAYFSQGYVLDYSAVTGGEGVLDSFLLSRCGNQTHFATLATLLYRRSGIPARYAEGYFLTPGDVAIYTSMPSIVFDLPDSSAHAWVEVYVNGFGWVPVEVTPGFYTQEEDGQPEEAVEDQLVENPEYYYLRDEVLPPAVEEDVPEETPQTWQAPAWLWLVLLPVGYVAACALYHQIRSRRFRQRDARRAIGAVYAYVARLLGSAGCRLPSTGCWAAAQAQGGRFDLPDGTTLSDFILLIYAVRYGRTPPSAEQAEFARRYAVGLTAMIRNQKPWYWAAWSWLIGRI